MLMLSLNKQLKVTQNASIPLHVSRNPVVQKRARDDDHVNLSIHEEGELLATVDESVPEVMQLQEENISHAPVENHESAGELVEQPKKKRVRRANDRDSRQAGKHSLLPCCSCKQKCVAKINEKRRQQLHEDYWEMSFDSRRAWMYSRIVRRAPKRRRGNHDDLLHKRTVSCVYSLPDENGESQTVCKDFFLKTLGYKSDKVITVLLSSNPTSQLAPKKDMRGRHAPSNKLSDDINKMIKEHIESYHPAVSHYRREHVPLRRYLPPELTINDLHKDFIEQHPQVASYQTYRKMVS